MDEVRVCRRCAVNLVVGDTWTECLKRSRCYECKRCYARRKRPDARHRDDPRDLTCKKCGAALVVGENWTEGQMKAWSYQCRSCNSLKGRRWFSANKDRAIGSQRERHLKQRGTDEELQRRDAKTSYYEANKAKWREYNDRARAKARLNPEKLARELIVGTKRRCDIMEIPFALEVQHIEPALRAGKCCVTGVPFDLSIGRGKLPFSPSLDRIDPALGYLPGNVRVVVWIYNLARSSWGDEPVLRMAEALSQRSQPLLAA